ncbi:PREDICTED: uncharacterized protein LOC109192361 isoform X2 [Ipomoea nil]|nr:PREDICTED: uncharacterized protein LOC109192361 isoform X2 [Ipomoea nil]
MNNEEEKRCPLCAEEMDWTDQQFKPCKCGYQVCVWCWHHIMDMAEKDETEGRCPACRSIYEKEKVVAMQTNFERVTSCHANGKNKPPKAKPKTIEVKKDLTNVRVIQRKMAYVIGLPLSLADEDLLQRKQYFGQYGKVTKVSLSRTAGGAVQQFVNDSCSVYITYSKEEEAVRCIQSVHGFILDGRYLRASFGTAKYCHAWLRNMPCNNSSCLYLHCLGADEDSFGKDETAAIHTRNRVQQITGNTNNMIRRSGNVLPPPVDEFSNTGSLSTEKPPAQNAPCNSTSGSLSSSSGHMSHSLCSNDSDGYAGGPKRGTTFVDIVGRSNISEPEKDGNSSQNWKNLNLCLDTSGTSINRDDLSQDAYSDIVHFNVSSSSHLQRDQSSVEFSDETFREDLISSDGQGSQDSNGLYQRTSFLVPSHSENFRESTGGNLLLHKGTCSSSNIGMDMHKAVHKQEDEASLPLSCVNMVLNDGYHDMKFQRSAKSDMVYRSSNSFSNEEIVEHLRRIEDDILTNDVESSAFGTIENSIISNIMSMNFDDEADGHHSSSWNSLNTGQSRLSFTNQDGIPSHGVDLESFRNFSQLSKQCSAADYEGNKEHYLSKPQYQVPRTRSLAPPGFSVSSLHTPPGFCACDGAGCFHRGISGSDSSGGNAADFVDPAILSFVKGTPINSVNTTGLEMGRAFTPQQRTLEDEARLWLLMQQKSAEQDSTRLSQMFAPPAPTTTHQDLRFLGRGGNEYSGVDNMYGFSSRLVDQSQNLDPSSLADLSQQKFVGGGGGGHISSRGYQHQHGLDEIQCRNEAGIGGEVERNQRFGVNYFGGGYGDLRFQAPSSGDVYTRVFGM